MGTGVFDQQRFNMSKALIKCRGEAQLRTICHGKNVCLEKIKKIRPEQYWKTVLNIEKIKKTCLNPTDVLIWLAMQNTQDETICKHTKSAFFLQMRQYTITKQFSIILKQSKQVRLNKQHTPPGKNLRFF